MKLFRIIIFIGTLMLNISALYAQDFLQKARNYLDAGECEKAQKAYNAYKVEHPYGNTDVERRITECKQNPLYAFESNVYSVKMTEFVITAPEGSSANDILGDAPWAYHFSAAEMPIATGFITNDGLFITARHVVQPWAYRSNGAYTDPFTVANILWRLGATIDATIEAESRAGDRWTFNYTDFKVICKNDERIETSDGYFGIYIAKGYDYAYVQTNVQSNIITNSQLSTSIPVGTRLELMGFPYDGDRNSLQYTTTTTSASGLLNGSIQCLGTDIPVGNGGSPVFCKNGDKYYVVGFVSSPDQLGKSQILPISEILPK